MTVLSAALVPDGQMKRFQLFAIHDQAWCPRTLRDAETEHLQFAIAATSPYAAMDPILVSALRRAGAWEVLDLCSGAAGPRFWLNPILAAQGLRASVCLTDKYPNSRSSGQSGCAGERAIRYHPTPVDAICVPEELTGFRTLFTAFRHSLALEPPVSLAEGARSLRRFSRCEPIKRGVLPGGSPPFRSQGRRPARASPPAPAILKTRFQDKPARCSLES